MFERDAAPDAQGFVDFGEVARMLCHQQNQYCSRYLTGTPDRVHLGAGLRYHGDEGNYHSLRLHKDDVEEFVTRVYAWRVAAGQDSRTGTYLRAVEDWREAMSLEPGDTKALLDEVNGLACLLEVALNQRNDPHAAIKRVIDDRRRARN